MDSRKRCRTAGNTLPRGFAAFFGGLNASIAVPNGDGHPGRRVPTPRFAPHEGESSESPLTGRPKRQRRLCSIVLDRGTRPSVRSSPFRTAMDARGAGFALSPDPTPTRRDSGIPPQKTFKTTKETLLGGFERFLRSPHPSIAVSPGNGRGERGGRSPPISTPGGEGGTDRRLNAMYNLGEDSSPWF